MRRRTPEQKTRTEAPAWCTSFGAGAAYAVELTGSRDMAVWLPALRAAQWQWCQANGCHRVSRTCEEASGHHCERPPGVS